MSILAVSTHYWHDKVLSQEELAEIRASGFRHVEIFATPPHVRLDSSVFHEKLPRILHELELEICSAHAPYLPHLNIASLNERRRKEALHSFEHVLDWLAALGGKFLVLHPGTNLFDPKREEAHEREALRSIQHLVEYAGRLGLSVALENPPPGEFLSDARRFIIFLDKVRPLGCRFCLDTGHAFIQGLQLNWLNDFRKQLISVHISDNRGINDDHLAPEYGLIPWDRYMDFLVEWDNGQTYWVLEIDRNTNPPGVLIQTYNWFKQYRGDIQ